ncbi:MAG TPA: hypothetical protein VJH33_03785 [Candidatus Paceibacterota bacterium]
MRKLTDTNSIVSRIFAHWDNEHFTITTRCMSDGAHRWARSPEAEQARYGAGIAIIH